MRVVESREPKPSLKAAMTPEQFRAAFCLSLALARVGKSGGGENFCRTSTNSHIASIFFHRRSRFLRDYRYVPLDGNGLGEKCSYAHLMVTMLLGGLRHGKDSG
jgi:D-alanyl-lipoteichoic acid acyltransferase DltB (MBOAT superfamily)